MGELLLQIVLSDNLPIVQLAIIAYVGAIFGEIKKEIDDEIPIAFWKFVVSWLSSGFGGIMIGLAVRGFINDNKYVSWACAGIAGYAGHEKTLSLSLGFVEKLLGGYVQKIIDDQKNKEKNP